MNRFRWYNSLKGSRVEIGVCAANVDRAVAKANVRQPVGIIAADGNVAADIGHDVVDALVPEELRGRIEVAAAPDRVRTKAENDPSPTFADAALRRE